MAISAVNASYSGQGPSASGQVLDSGLVGAAASNMDFYGTATCDGAATTFVVNFIDGTATLPFTPNGVIVTRTVKSTDTAAATVNVTPVGGTVSATGFTATISAAGSNGNLISFAGRVIR